MGSRGSKRRSGCAGKSHVARWRRYALVVLVVSSTSPRLRLRPSRFQAPASMRRRNEAGMGGTSAVLANSQRARPSAEGRRLAQVMTLRGDVVSETRIASMSGPMITACVGLACVLLGLSVIWRGDASETAAGFWPPAGASLVAMLVFPVRRWAGSSPESACRRSWASPSE